MGITSPPENLPKEAPRQVALGQLELSEEMSKIVGMTTTRSNRTSLYPSGKAIEPEPRLAGVEPAEELLAQGVAGAPLGRTDVHHRGGDASG
jgi:hypothetical protein